MSYVCFNRIAIAGPRSKVLGFRNDAHRRLSPALKEAIGEPYVAFSLERLFRKNRLSIPSPDGIPFDAFRLGNDIVGGHYFTSRLPVAKWHGYARIEYSVEVKNYSTDGSNFLSDLRPPAAHSCAWWSPPDSDGLRPGWFGRNGSPLRRKPVRCVPWRRRIN
jgi:hypothetical protein